MSDAIRAFTKAAPQTSPAAAERRTSGAGLFANLENHKRSSADSAAAARRQSFHDMKPQAGFIGQMWHSFTKGVDPK